MIVIDASVLYEAIIETPYSAAIVDRIFSDDETLHAPHLVDLEIVNTLRRYVLKGELSERSASQAMEDFASIPLKRHTHTGLIPRIWQLRNNLTAYDAAYIALAEMLNVPLITRDTAFASSTGHNVHVELI